jgi:hypothetical protein
MAEWYYAKGKNEKAGPLTIEQLARAFLNGEINADTYVQKEGMEKWRRFDRLSVYEKLNAMRAEMAQKKLSESFLKDSSPDASTSYIAGKKAVSLKLADKNAKAGNNPQSRTAPDEEPKPSFASQAATLFSYAPYAFREILSKAIGFIRHAITITAYGSLALILVAEINNYAKFNIGFLDTVHTQVAAVLKGRGAQTSFKSSCDNSSAEQRAMSLESLDEKVKLFEELGELAEAEKTKRRIAGIEAVADNCVQ